MSQQEGARRGRSGLFVNPVGPRRAEFARACADLFGDLRLADGADEAGALLAQQPADLLVLDLERFEIGIDLPRLGQLVARCGGGQVLVLCPFANARWLPALMAHGPLDYLVGPLASGALRAELAARLEQERAPAPAPGPAGTELAALLAVRAAAQGALAEADDSTRFGERLCAALLGWPGVVHAAMFQLHASAEGGGDLRLQAWHDSRPAPAGLDLAALLGRADDLLHAPLRHAFPGLLAAATGELALLDTPDKAGEPALAEALRGKGVQMVLGLPIPAVGPDARRPTAGALCLMFDAAHPFSRAGFAALDDLAQLAAFGLRMAALVHESEALLARVTQLATLDALTGVANRRHGEQLLEQEVKRARRYRLPLALIAFDIDRFRNINDTYGHPVGDMALRSVADTVRAVLRSSDVLVRSGGEEFQVIAPHTSAIEGLKLAEKLRAAIEAVEIPGCDHLTISLGVAQLGELETGDSLAVRVNAALARAKRAGRNCVELAMR
ncbi:GGDEF domain-containing protein [Massilia sp. UMI-21]|nr:GGDEF domain-containing protein [Massilia sp. UMI-21]